MIGLLGPIVGSAPAAGLLLATCSDGGWARSDTARGPEAARGGLAAYAAQTGGMRLAKLRQKDGMQLLGGSERINP